jgi:hypothetical protein
VRLFRVVRFAGFFDVFKRNTIDDHGYFFGGVRTCRAPGAVVAAETSFNHIVFLRGICLQNEPGRIENVDVLVFGREFWGKFPGAV